MKLGISAIGWEPENQSEVLLHLPDGIELLEVVPARRQQLFTGYLQVYSAQSIFWGVPIDSFTDTHKVEEHFAWLLECAQRLHLQRMVLGSPGLRKGSYHPLLSVLKKFDDEFAENNTIICIEPIAKQYGGNYFFTVEEIVEAILPYQFKAVRTMIDTANLWLQNQCPADVLYAYFPYIAHVHVSDKNIGPIVEDDDHVNFASALRGSGYSQAVVRELLHCQKYPGEYHLFAEIYKP